MTPSMTSVSPVLSANGGSDPCFAAHANNLIIFSQVISIVDHPGVMLHLLSVVMPGPANCQIPIALARIARDDEVVAWIPITIDQALSELSTRDQRSRSSVKNSVRTDCIMSSNDSSMA